MLPITQFGFCLGLLFLIGACRPAEPIAPDSAPDRSARIRAQAEAYFDTFAERRDWEKLLSFYSDSLQFEDALMQLHLDYTGFVEFYDWPNPAFRKRFPEQRHLVVEHLIFNDSMAVAYGHLNPFYWEGKLFELEWNAGFTIWLWFDNDLKIRRQIDWFEYPGDVLQSIGKRLEAGAY